MSSSYAIHSKEFRELAQKNTPWFDLNSSKENLLANISDFNAIIDRECLRSERFQQDFSLVTFKKTDDQTFEHLLQVLARRLRTSDAAGWISHEYIGVLLSNASSQQNANCFVKSIHNMMKSREVALPEYHIHLYAKKWNHEESETTADFQYFNTVRKSSPCPTLENPIQLPIIEMKNPPVLGHLFPHGMPWWKRTIDLIGGTFGLLVLMPLLVVTAIYIKMVSPGPIFFRQPRAGYLGKPFIIWKFRTMKVNANVSQHQSYIEQLLKNGKPMYKLEDADPQIIPHGNALRKTGIDELPQLINVLRGEMSLVGPRPDVFYAIKNYKSWYHARSDAFPGLTGLWQVSGKNNISYEEMMRLDIKYAHSFSFWLDVKILLLTPITIAQQVLERLKRRKQS
ncbi:MAG: hypothetical protein RIT27_667 [Pseudomonadota bacterium]|jgi:lipopolysaccharide/colanic/teichoic acid biosynthesis glycosyltransferase